MIVNNISNNLQVVAAAVNIQEIVSIGMFFRVGSRDEAADTNGITHLMEHVISEKFINNCYEAGGLANAITTKEYCCFFAKCSVCQLEPVLKCFREICEYSDNEKHVLHAKRIILNEMQGGNGEEGLEQQLFEEHLRNVSLSFLPQGRKENIVKIGKEQVEEYFNNNIRPDNCVVSIVGAIDEEQVIFNTEKLFSDWCAISVKDEKIKKSYCNKDIACRKLEPQKETQTIRMLFDGVARNSEQQMAIRALCNYLGGGTHSKLFQYIRNKSIAYNAFCVSQSFLDTGIIYLKIVGISESAPVVMREVSSLLLEYAGRQISDTDLQIVKRNLIEEHLYKHETLSSKMTLYGLQLLLDGTIRSDKVIMESINMVSAKDIESAYTNMLVNDITLLFNGAKTVNEAYFNRTFF